MGSKEDALFELEAVMQEYDLSPSGVGRLLFNDPGFVTRLRDPAKTVSARSVDKVNNYVRKMRGQTEMDLS